MSENNDNICHWAENNDRQSNCKMVQDVRYWPGLSTVSKGLIHELWRNDRFILHFIVWKWTASKTLTGKIGQGKVTASGKKRPKYASRITLRHQILHGWRHARSLNYFPSQGSLWGGCTLSLSNANIFLDQQIKAGEIQSQQYWKPRKRVRWRSCWHYCCEAR
jgi:hypothetical protein